MAVRFDGASDSLTRTRLAGAKTAMGWFRIAVDRNDYSAFFDLGENAIVCTDSDGTTLIGFLGYDFAYGSTALTVGTWYHVAVTIDSDTNPTMIVYVNGAQAGSATQAYTLTGTTMYVGSNRYGEWLNGSAAHVKLWSAVLTAAEVQQEMHTVVPARSDNLVGWYPLDTHTDVSDWSGNGNNWTANGTLATEDNPPVTWGGAFVLPQFVSGGGGTNYNQSAAGALAPAAALIRQSTALRAGATAPAGALLRTTRTARAGATTPAGGATKQTTRPLAGAATPGGALSSVRLMIRALAGAFEPAGALARATVRTAAGAITPAAAALKQTTRALAGGAAPSGALSNLKLFLVEMAGAFAPTGGLLRTTARALTGASVPTGAALKSTARALAGAITPSAALSSIKTLLAYIEGALTPAGGLAQRAQKALSGAVTPAAAMIRSTARALAGSMTPSGAASGLRLLFVTLTGALTPAGGLIRQTAQQLAGAVSPAAAVTKAIVRDLAGAVSTIGALIAAALGLNPLAQAATSDALVFHATASNSGAYAGAASDMIVYGAVVTDAIAG